MNKKILIGSIIAVAILVLVSIPICVSSDGKSNPINTNPLIPPDSGLYYVTPPIQNWFKYGIYQKSYEVIKKWGDKPFSNTTLMFIGSGIGFRPSLNTTIVICSYYPDNPSKLNVYSDGEFYETIYAKWTGGPICLRKYYLHYYEKGFHRLRFVAGDNSTHVDIDVQIGFREFTQHILPYLIN